jgi:hypothetical protein
MAPGPGSPLPAWQGALYIPITSRYAAHVLRNHSPHKDKNALRDVFFTFKDAAALFSQANLVVLICNAGREIVPVEPVARRLEGLSVDHEWTACCRKQAVWEAA